MPGKLYMIGTPIGNFADISNRAIETLRQLDRLYCEDTRVTLQLLSAIGISLPCESLHDDSPESRWTRAVEQAVSGKTIGFVSDAGMPGISDPGRKLTRLAWDAGISVTVVPGPSSVGTLLAVCPFIGKRFTFLGFAPRSAGDLETFISSIVSSDVPVIFFDSPKRVHGLLDKLVNILDQTREIMIGREMTKVHEQFILFRPAEWQTTRELIPELGEYSIAVSASKLSKDPEHEELLSSSERLSVAGFSNRDVAAALSAVYNIPLNRVKSLVYGE